MAAIFTMILATLKDIGLGIVMRIAFKTVAERFATRAVIYGLISLRDMSTNDVVEETLTDIIDSLKGKKLHVVDKEEIKVKK